MGCVIGMFFAVFGIGLYLLYLKKKSGMTIRLNVIAAISEFVSALNQLSAMRLLRSHPADAVTRQ